MAPQTTNAPYLDTLETFGQGYAQAQVHRAPFLDTLATWAPEIVQGVPDTGLSVWLPGVELTGSFARSFRDELGGAGSWSISMENDDPDMPDYGDIVFFKIAGITRFAGRVEMMWRVTFGQGDEADEVTVLSGRGRLAVLSESQVAPARGLDALPVELVRSWFWGSVDFPDDDWENAKRTNRVGTYGRPEGFPDFDAWWVWADRSSVSSTSAPPGRCLFRHHYTTADDATLRFFFGTDNFGPIYIDGAQVADTSTYKFGEYVELEQSAGEHVIAIDCLNTGRHGGVLFSVWEVDADGVLDPDGLVTHSDASNTLCFPYVAGNGSNMPKVTFGWVARMILEERQANGELAGVTLGFTDYTDTDGQAWTPVAEITADVGRDVIDAFEALTDWLIDMQMAPGTNRLRAWNWGTRGHASGVTVVATADPDTSEYEGLTHNGRGVRANRLWFKWRGGYGEAFATGVDPDVDDIVSQYVDLSEFTTEAAAYTAAKRLLDNRAQPSWAHTLTLAPADDGSEPYMAFDNGDTITHLDQDGASGPQRVRSIAFTEDENGTLTKVLETNDLRFEVEERHENMLRRKAHGSLAGGARVASRSGESISSATRISLTNLIEFSFQDPVDGALTGKRPADSSGNLLEISVEVSTEDDSATTSGTEVEIWQYVFGTLGHTVIGSVTVPAGDAFASTQLDVLKVTKDNYKYRAHVVSVDSDVTGIDVQLRGI